MISYFTTLLGQSIVFQCWLQTCR